MSNTPTGKIGPQDERIKLAREYVEWAQRNVDRAMDDLAHARDHLDKQLATPDELQHVLTDLAVNQTRLGAEFEAVWDANTEELYQK